MVLSFSLKNFFLKFTDMEKKVMYKDFETGTTIIILQGNLEGKAEAISCISTDIIKHII